MFLGLFAIGLSCGLFAAASNGGPQVAKFKQEHPVISIITLLFGAYLIIYLLDGILVFLLGILLPFSGKSIGLFLLLCSILTYFQLTIVF
jgi:hypothetical protein